MDRFSRLKLISLILLSMLTIFAYACASNSGCAAGGGTVVGNPSPIVPALPENEKNPESEDSKASDQNSGKQLLEVVSPQNFPKDNSAKPVRPDSH